MKLLTRMLVEKYNVSPNNVRDYSIFQNIEIIYLKYVDITIDKDTLIIHDFFPSVCDNSRNSKLITYYFSINDPNLFTKIDMIVKHQYDDINQDTN